MPTETANNVMEEVFDNFRKAAEENLKMQQELVRQWTSLLPGLPMTGTGGMTELRDFQKRWSETVSELAQKHREVVNRQYEAATESLDEALRCAEAKNPEEFRKRSEKLFRKTIDGMRQISEAQLSELKDAANKWTKLVSKAD